MQNCIISITLVAIALPEVSTPGATTIAALCAAVGCEEDQMQKAVFLAWEFGEEDIVLALIRGALEVNEVK